MKHSLHDWIDTLQTICDAAASVAGSIPRDRIPGSQASKEAQSLDVDKREFLELAFVHGIQGMLGACDHGFALCRALDGSLVLSFSPGTLTRGLMEATTSCLWLLDNNIGASARASRGVDAELSDIKAIQKFQKRAGNHEAESSSLAEREALLSRASKSGIDPTLTNITTRVSKTFGSLGVYSLLSSVAHGNRRLPLTLATLDRPTRQRQLPKHIGPLWYVGFSAEWLGRSLWATCNLFEWNVSEVRLVLEREFDRFGLDTDTRFWRH